ncbi:hypothetical protein [Thalassobacillus sp. CUG 92003]|uniref:hypothetical protein n=1 Tax=Thalassobacillus sp. CUG 92003 TaxID=2736641 RepID=UPI0015E6452B|nr:hypothetical protein [Thalassobacillus sp. CUG 92003]
MNEDRNKHHGSQGQMNPIHDQCKRYTYYHVIISMSDGNSVDGIIIDVDDHSITVLVGEDVEHEEERQFYGGYGRRRARRFGRRTFPLAALTALALFPYFTPYYPPYYPYYY